MTEMTVAGLVLVLLACSWPASEAASYDARTFPNPMLKPTACGMGSNESFVCDPDKILQPLQATQLNNLIASKTKSFRCTCKDSCTSYKDKYAMMVAIVKRVNIALNASMEEKKFAVDQFAKDLQERGWAGGNCQNDIVIVLSTEYKKISVRVGDEGKKVLSDGCIAKAIEVTKSGITYGRYHRVLQNLVVFLSEKIDEKCADLPPYGKVTPTGPTEQKFIFPFWGIILIVVGVVSIAMAACLWSFKRKHRKEAARRYHVSDHPIHEPGKKGTAAVAEEKTLMS